MTRSGLVLSRVLPNRAATRPESIFSPQRWSPSGLGLLHEMLPKAIRIAVLVDPVNGSLRDIP
jgi:hypothetical protein